MNGKVFYENNETLSIPVYTLKLNTSQLAKGI